MGQTRAGKMVPSATAQFSNTWGQAYNLSLQLSTQVYSIRRWEASLFGAHTCGLYTSFEIFLLCLPSHFFSMRALSALQAALWPFHAAFWQAVEQNWARLQLAQICTSSSASLTPSRFKHLQLQIVILCSLLYVIKTSISKVVLIRGLHQWISHEIRSKLTGIEIAP